MRCIRLILRTLEDKAGTFHAVNTGLSPTQFISIGYSYVIVATKPI